VVTFRRERDWVLGEFKAGRSPILIATDVASRGLGMHLSLPLRALQRRVTSNMELRSVFLDGVASYVVS
jgi:hypothetical protein